MPFRPGESGNPGGRRKEKIFTEALRLVLNEEIEDPKDATQKKKKARIIAERLVTEAMDGQSWAVQQVMDRMDGKPPQAIVGGDEDDAPIRIEKIVREIVRAPSRGSSEGPQESGA